jgi:hypothetical protein
MTRRALAAWFPSVTGGITGCVNNWEGGQNFPTWDAWKRCAEAMQAQAPIGADARPYLVHPSVWPGGDLRASYDHLRASYDHLRAEYEHLRSEYEHLRSEYEAQRVPFFAPVGVSNVWSAPQVAGRERLSGDDGQALHPCQKPTVFASRMILASSRPGETVLEPFGGTCRVAVACESMSDAQARRYVCVEPDLDGRGYLEAVNREIRGRLSQGDLFRTGAP